MICKVCGSEFDAENFDLCPYCLAPINERTEILREEKTADLSINEPASVNERNIPDRTTDPGITEEFLPEEEKGMECSPEEILIDELDVPTRARNVLHRYNIATIAELELFAKEHDLNELKNAGEKTINFLEKLINEYGNNNYDKTKYVAKKETAKEEYPFANISNEAGDLPVDVLATFGMPSQSPTFFRKQGLIFCRDLKLVSDQMLIKLKKAHYAEKAMEVAPKLERGVVELVEDLLSNPSMARSREIFSRRANGETLKSIGDNLQEDGGLALTRERVRQIERNYGETLRPFMEIMMERLREGRVCVPVQDLLDIYDNDDYDRIVVHGCKQVDSYEYLDFAEIFVKRDGDVLVEPQILNVLTEYIGEEADLSRCKDELAGTLESNGFGYISIQAAYALLKKNGYKIFRDFVVKGSIRYGKICANVVKDEFPNGIKLTQNNYDESQDLNRLRKLVKERYGEVYLPEGNRALTSRLADCLILRGRGLYCAEENVEVDLNVLEDIVKYVDASEETTFFYTELYGNFKGVLNLTCGIDNYNYLHGVLQLYYPDRYEYSRDKIEKKQKSQVESRTVADKIYDFISKAGRPVKKQELKTKFEGFSEIMLAVPFYNDKRLLRWGYCQYTCDKFVHINDEDKTVLHNILNGVIQEYGGYSSSVMLYRATEEMFPDFLKKNKMVEEQNLYYVMERLFGDEYDFRVPHIREKGKTDIGTIKDIVLHLLGHPPKLSFNEYRMLVNKMKWGESTAGFVFADIEKDYVRVSQDDYVIKTDFAVDSLKIHEIERKITQEMENGIIALTSIDFESFPDIGYEWNPFLMESVIRETTERIKVIQPQVKDRRYQKGIAVQSERGLTTYSQIIADKMSDYGIEALPEEQFLSFLVVNNLTMKTIPVELYDSECIKKDGDFFRVVRTTG